METLDLPQVVLTSFTAKSGKVSKASISGYEVAEQVMKSPEEDLSHLFCTKTGEWQDSHLVSEISTILCPESD